MSLLEYFNLLNESTKKLQKLVDMNPMDMLGTKEGFELARKKESPYWCESCKSLNYECNGCDCNSCIGRE